MRFTGWRVGAMLFGAVLLIVFVMLAMTPKTECYALTAPDRYDSTMHLVKGACL